MTRETYVKMTGVFLQDEKSPQDYSGKPAACRNCFCELSALSDLAAA